MRALNQTPNIGAATGAFPDGVIVDEAGGVTGTALTEILYGDLIQLIHKLRRLAPITPNNLPDNETNGFQLLDAMNRMFIPRWTPSGQGVDFANVKFVQHGQGIYYHKTAVNTTNSPNLDTTNWTLVCQWDGLKMVYADGLSASALFPTYQNLTLAPGVTTTGTGQGNGWAYVAKQGKLYTVQFYLKLDASVSNAFATVPATVDFNINIPDNLVGDKSMRFLGYDYKNNVIFPFLVYQVGGATVAQLQLWSYVASERWVSGTASWYGA